MQWLTPEEAIETTGISVSVSQLHEYAQQSSDNTTPEEQFAVLGLLFDSDRYSRGEAAFLQLLTPQPQSDNEDEPYDLERCTVRVVLTLLPPEPESEKERKVIVAASTHNDLPVAQVIPLADLEPLPQAISDILQQLAVDLPNRRYRAQVKRAKTEKKPKQRQLRSQSESTSTDPSSVQINLFGL